MTFNWTDECVEKLRQLCDKKLSYRDIGLALGCSKNAAIAKAARMKMTNGRPAHVTAARIVRRVAARRAFAEAQKNTAVEAADGPPSLRIPLAEIGPDQCRYIAGEVRVDATCCGHPVKPLTPWCPFHFARCFNLSATDAARHAAEAARMFKRVA